MIATDLNTHGESHADYSARRATIAQAMADKIAKRPVVAAPKQVACYTHRIDAMTCALLIGGHFAIMQSAGMPCYGVFEGAKSKPMPLPV